MNAESTIALLHNLFFSENKPAEMRPVDIGLITYLLLRQTEDHFINDGQLTLASRLGCKRDAIADSIRRLDDLGWITTKEPWVFNSTTKRKTRRVGGTIRLAVNVAKLPKAKDRTKHLPPSPDAVAIAMQHNQFLEKRGTRITDDFRRRQELSAQRIIEELGSVKNAFDVLNFAKDDVRFKKAFVKSLYEVRTKLSGIKSAYEGARTKVTMPA